MLKKLKKYSKGMGTSGFTLIELLIVVVIIGILAGVLITIIDPESAQNRAKDAGIEATLNKVALATEAYGSAYGSYPDGASFIGSLSGSVSEVGSSCASGGDACTFDVTGNGLGTSCDLPAVPYWYGNGSGDCYYHYERTGSGSSFNLYAKSAGDNTAIFKYSAQTGKLFRCSGADATTVNVGASGCTEI